MEPRLPRPPYKVLKAMRIRTRRYSVRRLKSIKRRLFRSAGPGKENRFPPGLGSNSVGELLGILRAASCNYPASQNVARLLQGKVPLSPGDQFEDDVSVTDDDDDARDIGDLRAMRPSCLALAHLHPEPEPALDPDPDPDLVGKGSSTARAPAHQMRAPPPLAPFLDALRSVAAPARLPRPAAAAMACALRAYAVHVRTQPAGTCVRDALAETRAPEWFGAHAETAGPHLVRAVSARTRRRAAQRTAGVLRVHGADGLGAFRERTAWRAAGLSALTPPLGADAVRVLAALDAPRAAAAGRDVFPEDAAAHLLARLYGGTCGAAADPAQLAELYPLLGTPFCATLAARARAKQAAELAAAMAAPSRPLAARLVAAFGSADAALRAPPRALQVALRMGPQALRRVCVALFGQHRALLARLAGFTRHPYAAAAAVARQIGSLEDAAELPLGLFCRVQYPAADEAEAIRLFVLLSNQFRTPEAGYREFTPVAAAVAQIAAVRAVEDPAQTLSDLLEEYGNSIRALSGATPEVVVKFAAGLRPGDVVAMQMAVRKVLPPVECASDGGGCGDEGSVFGDDYGLGIMDSGFLWDCSDDELDRQVQVEPMLLTSKLVEQRLLKAKLVEPEPVESNLSKSTVVKRKREEKLRKNKAQGEGIVRKIKVEPQLVALEG